MKKSIEYIENRPDIIGSICGLIIGVAILFISFYYKLRQEYLGFALICGSLIYIIFRKNLIDKKPLEKKYSDNHIGLLIYVYMIIYIISLILSKGVLYQRPTSYFIAIIILSLIILLQILKVQEKNIYSLLILFEILALSINIRMSIYYQFEPVYEVNDVDYYINLTNNIIENGNIPIIYENLYHKLPIMPLILSTIKLLSGMNIKNSYFMIGIIELFTTIFIFMIAMYVFDFRTGLLSVLILNLSDYFTLYGFWIIAMDIGIFFVGMLLFLIVKNISISKNSLLFNKSIIMVLLITIILTHTITTLVTLIILISIFIALFIWSSMSKSIPKYDNIHMMSSLIIFFGISFLSYWIFILSENGTLFLQNMTNLLVQSIAKSEIGNTFSVTMTANMNFFSVILSKAGFIILACFMIIGCLIILIPKNMSLDKFVIVFIAIGILSAIYIPSLIGIGILLPARWFVFAYLIICILSAYGMVSIINLNSSKLTILIIISLMMFTFFMITSPLIDSDNVFYSKELTQRVSLYDSERALNTFIDKGNIVNVSKNVIYKLNVNNAINLNQDNPKSYLDKIILIRNYDIEKGFRTMFSRGGFGEFKKISPEFNKTLKGNKSHIIYDNSEVKAYIIYNTI